MVSFLPLFSLIILVLGTILGGLATPAEAAAVGAFGALVLSYFYKTLKWKNFKESVFLTAKTTAMIMWLFIGSWTFASVFSYLGGHEVFEHFFKSMNLQSEPTKKSFPFKPIASGLPNLATTSSLGESLSKTTIAKAPTT